MVELIPRIWTKCPKLTYCQSGRSVFHIEPKLGAHKMIYAYEHDLNAIEKTEILRYQVLTNQKSYKKAKQLL